MRLLLVSNTYPPGDISGVGTLVQEIASEVDRRGGEVRVLTRLGGRSPRVESTGGSKLLFPLRAALKLILRGGSWRPTIIHVHESDGILVLAWLRVCRALGIEWAQRCRGIATLQVSYRRERLAVRPLIDDAVVLSVPVPSELAFRRWRAPILATLGRWTAALADAVVAPSTETARELEVDYRAEVTAVIANGVQAGGVGGMSEPRVSDTILYVGRLRTRKAVAVLLAAMKVLHDRGVAAKLVVAGDGEQGEALALKRAELALETHVELLGAVDRSELGGLYRDAGIFCLPSTYEGFPLAILEAMDAGLPVVSTRVAGIPEAVEEGVTGMLVDAEDVGGLADALERLLADPELRRRMGEAGRRRLIEKFEIGTIVSLHLALYERVTAAR